MNQERKLSGAEAYSCFVCPNTPCLSYFKVKPVIVSGKSEQVRMPGTYCTCEPWSPPFSEKETGP